MCCKFYLYVIPSFKQMEKLFGRTHFGNHAITTSGSKTMT